MKDIDEDTLLGQHLSGDPPREAFREQTLRDSTAALVWDRRRRSVWRRAELAAVAVLVIGVGFLGGRLSGPRTPTRPVGPAHRVVGESHGVTVPTELVAWLEAAGLFRQLGMQDRMARAVDRAGRLIPHDATSASGALPPVFTAASDGPVEGQSQYIGSVGMPPVPKSSGSMDRIMAQSLGGCNHASQMD